MARQLVVLILVLFAVVGLVLADPPKASPGTSAAESPDSIGPVDDPAGTEGGDDVVEGPVGGPTPLGEYAAAAAMAPTGSGSAETLQISAGVGGAAAALAGLFF